MANLPNGPGSLIQAATQDIAGQEASKGGFFQSPARVDNTKALINILYKDAKIPAKKKVTPDDMMKLSGGASLGFLLLNTTLEKQFELTKKSSIGKKIAEPTSSPFLDAISKLSPTLGATLEVARASVKGVASSIQSIKEREKERKAKKAEQPKLKFVPLTPPKVIPTILAPKPQVKPKAGSSFTAASLRKEFEGLRVTLFDLPKFPNFAEIFRNIKLPKFKFPEIKWLKFPKFSWPVIKFPAFPKINWPKFPKFTLPKLPKLAWPKLPKLPPLLAPKKPAEKEVPIKMPKLPAGPTATLQRQLIRYQLRDALQKGKKTVTADDVVKLSGGASLGFLMLNTTLERLFGGQGKGGGIIEFFKRLFGKDSLLGSVMGSVGKVVGHAATAVGSFIFKTAPKAIGTFLKSPAAKAFGSLAKKFAGPVAGALAAAMMIVDGIAGAKKAKEWGVGAVNASVSAALAGTGKGWKNALRNTGKGAGIGMLIAGPVGAAIGGAIGGVLGFIGGENLAKGIKKAGEWVGKAADAIWDFFKKIGAGIWDWIKGAAVWIGTKAKEIWEGIKNVASDVWDFFKEIGVKIGGFVAGIWGWVADQAANVWGGIKNVASTVWDFFKEIGAKIGGFVAGIWTWVTEQAGNVWSGIKNVAASVWDFFKEIGAKIGGFVAGVWEWVKNQANETWTGVKNVGSSIFGFFGNIGSAILDFIKGMPGWIAEKAAGVWETVKATSLDIFNKVRDIPGTVLKKIQDKWAELTGGDVITGVKGAIGKLFSSVSDFFTGIGDTFAFVKSYFEEKGFLKGAADLVTDIAKGDFGEKQTEFVSKQKEKREVMSSKEFDTAFAESFSKKYGKLLVSAEEREKAMEEFYEQDYSRRQMKTKVNDGIFNLDKNMKAGDLFGSKRMEFNPDDDLYLMASTNPARDKLANTVNALAQQVQMLSEAVRSYKPVSTTNNVAVESYQSALQTMLAKP